MDVIKVLSSITIEKGLVAITTIKQSAAYAVQWIRCTLRSYR